MEVISLISSLNQSSSSWFISDINYDVRDSSLSSKEYLSSKLLLMLR